MLKEHHKALFVHALFLQEIPEAGGIDLGSLLRRICCRNSEVSREVPGFDLCHWAGSSPLQLLQYFQECGVLACSRRLDCAEVDSATDPQTLALTVRRTDLTAGYLKSASEWGNSKAEW